MKYRKTLWITQTAVLIALLLTAQFFSKALGQYVTGSMVNFILVIGTMICGLASGLVVAAVSPVLAFLLGIGPALPQLLPVMVLGNASIVLIWHFIAGRAKGKAVYYLYPVAFVVGAAVKFCILYFGIVQIILPLLSLPEAHIKVLSATFSFPQLITAGIGGTLAGIITPLLRRVLPQSMMQVRVEEQDTIKEEKASEKEAEQQP